MASNRCFKSTAEVVSTILQSVKDYGLYQTMKRIHLYNTIRPGTHVGTDHLGNKYFEDKECLMTLRSRWVEIASANNKYDLNATNIPSDWYAWMTHITNDTPLEGGYPSPVYQLEHTPGCLSKMATKANYTPGNYYNAGVDVQGIRYPTRKWTSWTPKQKQQQ